MGFLPSLPKKTNLAHAIRGFPGGWPELLAFHDAVLRAESPLTIAERELLAAYVSVLNGCRFCANAHSVYAESYGVDGEVSETLLSDLDTSGVDPRFRPILAYARVLTLDPRQVTEAHVQAILETGWPEEAVAEANKVVALFNLMNRVVMGLGVDAFEAIYARRRAAVRERPLVERRAANETHLGASTYQDHGRQLGIVTPEVRDQESARP